MPKLRLLPRVSAIYTVEEAIPVLEYLMKRGGPLAIDSETTGLDKFRSRILFWSMATDRERYMFPVELLLLFDPLFQRADITWYMANAKYDMHQLANMGVALHGPIHDIVVMDAMDDDTRSHGLKQQARDAYGVSWGDFKDLFLDPEHVSRTLGLEKSSFAQFKKLGVGDRLLFVHAENPRMVEDYASCDAYFTYLRAEDLRSQLSVSYLPTDMVPGFATLYDYFTVIEVPFTNVLWDMEREGVPIDLDYVKKIDGPLRDGIRAKEAEIRKLAGPTFNPNSTDELRDYLFTKHGLGLSPISYTKSAKKPLPSTAEKDLKILLGRIPPSNDKAIAFLKAIMERTRLNKLHGTFVKNVHTHLAPDGRIHSSINQAGARTGRLSSSDPNLQNIPIRGDIFHIRGMFCAPIREKMMDFDYPQIQPRLAAVLAGEDEMMAAIRRGWDIHSANAGNMYKHVDPTCTYENLEAAKAAKDARKRELTKEEKELLRRRDGAKTVGLGALFGEGPTKMAQQLGFPDIQTAKDLIATFFKTYPNIKRLIDEMHVYGHETETTYTMLGRLRRLHRINNGWNNGLAAQEERIAFNHLIQGSETEVMKCAMLQIAHNKEFKQLGARLALTVHDELISFAPEDTAKEAFQIQKALMADPLRWGPISLTLPVPVDPDGAIGDNWADIH